MARAASWPRGGWGPDVMIPHHASRTLLADFSRHVHFPSYLRYLIRFGMQYDRADPLTVLVAPAVLRDHPDLVELGERSRWVRFVTISAHELRLRQTLATDERTSRAAMVDLLRGHRLYGAWHDWDLMCRYAQQLGATRLFVAHLDPYLPLLASGADAPVPVEGIYFAPTFHYPQLGMGQLQPGHEQSALREKFMLARALQNPCLQRILILDGLAAAKVAAMPGGHKVVSLPDPVESSHAPSAEVEVWRRRFNIPADRKVLLLFGQLTERKGLEELLNAIRELQPRECDRCCLLLVGVIDHEYRQRILPRLEEARNALGLLVVHHPAYVPEADVAALFQLSHGILVPYPRHAGMSGVVLLAAAAGRPVLSSDYGLMAAFVRQHRLGLTVDVTDPRALALALRQLIDATPGQLIDRDYASRMVAMHHPTRFAALILKRSENERAAG
jgi:glycosyltransferase involved in cell wall biosynthesis